MSFHGSSTCRRCQGNLVRDMYGVWYHDQSQQGIQRLNDDDHAPQPLQKHLIAIRNAETEGAQRAMLHAMAHEVQKLRHPEPWPQFGPFSNGADVRTGYNTAIDDVLELIKRGPGERQG